MKDDEGGRDGGKDEGWKVRVMDRKEREGEVDKGGRGMGKMKEMRRESERRILVDGGEVL